MLTVHNLTNSPFDLPGGHILPANGSWSGELPESYLLALKASPAVKVVEVAPEDTGGPDEELETWRSLYEAEKGERPDGRWSVKRIQKELGL